MMNALQVSPESKHNYPENWGIELLPGQGGNNSNYILYQNIDGYTASALLRPSLATLQNQNIESILTDCQLIILSEPENIIALRLQQKNCENALQSLNDSTTAKKQRRMLRLELLLQKLQQKLQKAWNDYATEQFAVLNLVQKALSLPSEVYCSEDVISALYALEELQNTSSLHQMGKIFPKLRFHRLHSTSETTEHSPTSFSSISESFRWGAWELALALEPITQRGAEMVCSKLAIFGQNGERASFIELELGRIKLPIPKKLAGKPTWSPTKEPKQANNRYLNPQKDEEKHTIFLKFLERCYKWAQNLHTKIKEQQVGQISNFTERQIARFLALQSAWEKPNALTPNTLLLCRWQITRPKCKIIQDKKNSKWLFEPTKLPMLRGQFCWVRPCDFTQTPNTGWEETFYTEFSLPASKKGIFENRPDFSTLYTFIDLEPLRSAINITEPSLPYFQRHCLAVWQHEAVLWQEFLQAAKEFESLATPKQRAFCLVIEREVSHFFQHLQPFCQPTEASPSLHSWRKGFHSKPTALRPLSRDYKNFWLRFFAASQNGAGGAFPAMMLWALWAQLEPRLANKLQRKPKIKAFLRKHSKGFAQLLQQLGAKRHFFMRPFLLGSHIYRPSSRLLDWLSQLFRQFFNANIPIQGTKAWQNLWEQMHKLTAHSQAKSKVRLHPKFSVKLAFYWPNWKESIERQLDPFLNIATSAEESSLIHITDKFQRQAQQAQRVAKLEQQVQQFQQHCTRNQYQMAVIQKKISLFSIARKFLKENLSIPKSPKIFMACKMALHSWRGAQNWKPNSWWLGAKACRHSMRRIAGSLYRFSAYSIYATIQLLWQGAAHWQAQNRQCKQRAEERRYQKEQRRRHKKTIQEQRREYKFVRSSAKKDQKQLASQAARQRRELSAAIRREAEQERHAVRLALIAETTQRLRERNFQQQNALLERQKVRYAAIELRHARLQQLRLWWQKRLVAVWTLYRKSKQSAAFIRNRLLDLSHFITQNPNRGLQTFYRRNRRMLLSVASISATLAIFALFIPKALYTDIFHSINFTGKQFQNWAAQLFVQENETNLTETAAPNAPLTSQQLPATTKKGGAATQQQNLQIQTNSAQNDSVQNAKQQGNEANPETLPASNRATKKQAASPTQPNPANQQAEQRESVSEEIASSPPIPTISNTATTWNTGQNTTPNAAGDSFVPAQQQVANPEDSSAAAQQPQTAGNNQQEEAPQNTNDADEKETRENIENLAPESTPDSQAEFIVEPQKESQGDQTTASDNQESEEDTASNQEEAAADDEKIAEESTATEKPVAKTGDASTKNDTNVENGTENQIQTKNEANKTEEPLSETVPPGEISEEAAPPETKPVQP